MFILSCNCLCLRPLVGLVVLDVILILVVSLIHSFSYLANFGHWLNLFFLILGIFVLQVDWFFLCLNHLSPKLG